MNRIVTKSTVGGSLTIALGICLLAGGLSAQDPKKLSDAEISKLLAGRWLWQPGSKMFIDITFAKDQTFKAFKGAGDLGYKASGNWKVDKGVLHITTKRISFGKEEINVEKSPQDWSFLPESKVLSIEESTLKLHSDLWKAALEFKKASELLKK